jgi:diaminohydroxyphosphoribosylaminopyrimidine deaminase/5-amino-6-(5-phosphoribosylamino)uracil reductase
VLSALAGRGITRLMIEAGPIVSAAFVNADLVDEAVVFRSPNAIGSGGIDALEGLPLEALTKSPRLSMTGTETAGADTIERFARVEI